MNWYMTVLKKYAVFSGRARRMEYWMFVLFNIIFNIVLSIIDTIAGLDFGANVGILAAIYSLGVLIPSLAVSVRRLHDTNRVGWWIFIVLVPLVGWIILIVFQAQDSQAGDNRFGPNPKASGKIATEPGTVH
jgi:uncharacterized membrane protein YhaH (DUF805 family)